MRPCRSKSEFYYFLEEKTAEKKMFHSILVKKRIFLFQSFQKNLIKEYLIKDCAFRRKKENENLVMRIGSRFFLFSPFKLLYSPRHSQIPSLKKKSMKAFVRLSYENFLQQRDWVCKIPKKYVFYRKLLEFKNFIFELSFLPLITTPSSKSNYVQVVTKH